jgi:tetratricopeptide (TPR) repeat protein
VRNKIIVVNGSGKDKPYTARVVRRLKERGLLVWSLDNDVRVGNSRIEAIDTELRSAIALVLVCSSATSQDAWAVLQHHAFQTQVRLSSTLKLIVIPTDNAPIGPSLLAQAIVLKAGLEPETAADFCCTVLDANADLSSFQSIRPVDNRNSPLMKPGAWPLLQAVSASYEEYQAAIGSLINIRRHYEKAIDVYWDILYYSGYHEHWNERLALSQQIVNTSREVRDLRNTGLVLAKGVAYVYMNRGQLYEAIVTLEDAFLYFQEAGDIRGEAICWTYLADIYAFAGKLPEAELAYERAASNLKGLEQQDVKHKLSFMRAAHSDLKPLERIAALVAVRDGFAAFADYREGLADIQIARTLYEVGSNDEALFHTERAIKLFGDTIGMPRHATRARRLLETIQRNGHIGSDVPAVLW